MPFATAAPAEKEVLDHTLKLREDRSGFAGVSVKVITIEPDGTWLEEHYLITEPGKSLEHQKRTKTPPGSGTLYRKDLDELKESLISAEFATLEGAQDNKDLGSSETQITISYGQHVVSGILSNQDDNYRNAIEQLKKFADSISLAIKESIPKSGE